MRPSSNFQREKYRQLSDLAINRWRANRRARRRPCESPSDLQRHKVLALFDLHFWFDKGRSLSNIVGFGYDLDSKLLVEIAREGNGKYAFIPDSSLVGTVFVNAMSNLMSTAANEVTLQLETQNETKLEMKDGNCKSDINSQSRSVGRV